MMGILKLSPLCLILLSSMLLLRTMHCVPMDQQTKRDPSAQPSDDSQRAMSSSSQNDCFDNKPLCRPNPGRMYYETSDGKTQIVSNLLSSVISRNPTAQTWRNNPMEPYWSRNRGRRQDAEEYRSGGMLEFPLFADEPQWIILQHDIRQLSDIDLGPFYVTRGRRKSPYDMVSDGKEENRLTPYAELNTDDDLKFDVKRVYDDRLLDYMFEARRRKSTDSDAAINVPFFGSRGKKNRRSGLKKTYWDLGPAPSTRRTQSVDQPFFAHRGKKLMETGFY